jgi:hypothetical protein
MERKEYPVTDARCSTVVADDMENKRLTEILQCFRTAQAIWSRKTGQPKLLRNDNNKNSPWFNSLPNYSDCAKHPHSVN